MFCSKCGKQIPDDSVFCPECGQSLSQAAPSPSPGATPSAPAPSVEVSPGLNIGIIVGSILIPLIGIVMGLIYMKDPDAAKQKAGKIWLWVGIGMGIFWILASLGGEF